jgi:2-oxoglutarate ferredoxin oxidoreductase subunit alpha
MTATSGPGISLYSENVGLAIMGEVPLVIVDVQRMGPGTGGATTVGQGDVQFVRWGTSGGYPIIALAPSSVSECREVTRRSFRLAQRFRCPVFVLADKELILTLATEERGSHRPEAPVPAVSAPAAGETNDDRPYCYDPPDGVPPLVPFGGERVVRFTGSSHDERGFLSKDPRTVGALNRHLQEKIERHGDEIEWVRADLQSGATTLLIAYGVTAGAAREALLAARSRGGRLSGLTPLSLWPVPEAALERAFAGVERVVVAELNLGDYRREIERLARGRFEVVGVSRVDGELISPRQILEAVP